MIDLAAAFSDIAIGISAEFGGPYVLARVIDQAADDLDDGGSIPDNPADPTMRDCMVQVDLATEAMRQSEGYAEGEARFLILVNTLSGSLSTDATVEVLAGENAGSWLVSSIERDSMSIYWQGRGRRA